MSIGEVKSTSGKVVLEKVSSDKVTAFLLPFGLGNVDELEKLTADRNYTFKPSEVANCLRCQPTGSKNAIDIAPAAFSDLKKDNQGEALLKALGGDPDAKCTVTEFNAFFCIAKKKKKGYVPTNKEVMDYFCSSGGMRFRVEQDVQDTEEFFEKAFSGVKELKVLWDKAEIGEKHRAYDLQNEFNSGGGEGKKSNLFCAQAAKFAMELKAENLFEFVDLYQFYRSYCLDRADKTVIEEEAKREKKAKESKDKAENVKKKVEEEAGKLPDTEIEPLYNTWRLKKLEAIQKNATMKKEVKDKQLALFEKDWSALDVTTQKSQKVAFLKDWTKEEIAKRDPVEKVETANELEERIYKEVFEKLGGKDGRSGDVDGIVNSYKEYANAVVKLGLGAVDLGTPLDTVENRRSSIVLVGNKLQFHDKSSAAYHVYKHFEELVKSDKISNAEKLTPDQRAEEFLKAARGRVLTNSNWESKPKQLGGESHFYKDGGMRTIVAAGGTDDKWTAFIATFFNAS